MKTLQKGTLLENTYEILEEIGSGGGGVVYKARHLRLQTDVVVKKIRNEVLGKVKSRQEADILKNLKHPYLPRVYDFIKTEDGVYTVMDFIHGTTVGEAVKEHGKYTEKQVRRQVICQKFCYDACEGETQSGKNLTQGKISRNKQGKLRGRRDG